MKKVVIVDSIGGNVGSVYRTVNRLKFPAVCSSDVDDILQASHIIMPGVGHFGHAMKRLKENNLIDTLNESVLIKKIPVLGICLGMQLMGRFSEEGNAEGLGWFDAEVLRFQFNDKKVFKTPHVGWNSIESNNKSVLLNGLDTEDQFYFVHSYYVKCKFKEDVLATSHYEQTFTSVIQKDNMLGVQFHPEKSYDAGDLLLRNFLKD
ncbi:MAG: imidazole glycerol phosphate synthase subunit HisH [Paludibacteraceae bacterium]